MHVWTSCRDKTSELLNESSNTSVDYQRCRTNAALTSGVSSLTVDPLAPLQQADDPAALGVNEAITTEKNLLPQTSQDESCTLDGVAKVMSLHSFVGSQSVLPKSGPYLCSNKMVWFFGLFMFAICYHDFSPRKQPGNTTVQFSTAWRYCLSTT